MARFGVDPGAIESRLLASTRGLEATRMRGDQSDVPIVLHTPRPRSIEQLLAERLPVTDALLPLGTFLRAEPADLPAVLLRSRQTSALRWSADRASGVGLAQAEAAVRRAASSAPQGRVRIGGASAAFAEGLRSLTVCLLLSLLLVYLILAAQLESLTQPLIILLAVPMAGIGAVFALALTGQSWNLMSLTGLVVLAGVAVNDAILKVDLVSRYRREGWAIEPALREAGRQRWRPMLMTTLTTVCGLLPLSFGFGYGSRLEAPLAIALAGGLLAATAMTMLVLPAIYPATGSRSLPRHRGQDPP
jgi:HAE1 family hydrophobic/amphiphilic exporter-1